MKSSIWCGLLLALLASHAWAADPNTPGSAITQATGASTGNSPSGPLYPAQPVGSANPLYVRSSTLALDASIQQLVGILNAPLSLPPGAATSALQTAGNASLVSILAKQPTLNGDGGAPAHVTNFPQTQSTTTNGFPLVNTATPFTVTTSSTSVTGLTLPGKVRFQASPVSTLGGGTGNTVSVQVSYSGGNACTSPNVILGPGQIDDWVYIPGSTAPTACAATSGGILLAVQ